MKVHELSKELDIKSKDLISLTRELNIDVKSHLSILNDEEVEKIKSHLNKPILIQEECIQEETKQWKPDLQRMICIENIARGKLVYKSKRQTGYMVEWPKNGDKNYLEIGEFINLKNSDRRFVTEPWVRVLEDDEVEILKYANILQYYKEILGFENVSEILKLDFPLFQKKFDKLPEGYKNVVIEHAAEMIKNGELDSIKIKNHIEETMGIEIDILTKPGKKQNDSISIK